MAEAIVSVFYGLVPLAALTISWFFIRRDYRRADAGESEGSSE